MKNNLSHENRARMVRSNLKATSGLEWLVIPLLVALPVSITLAYFLIGNETTHFLSALGVVVRDAFGFTTNSATKTFGWAPSALQIARANAFLSVGAWKLWIVLGSLIAVMFAVISLKEGRKTKEKRYLKLNDDEKDSISSRELARELSKAKRSLGPAFKPSPFDLELGIKGLRIPERSLASMLGVVGGAGQGKTNILNAFVASRRQTDEKCFIVDVNGEYAARFARKGDVILSLFDSRAAKWDLWSEDLPVEEIADAILASDESARGGSSEFFSTASRTVLASILKNCRSEKALWELITLERDALIERIRAMPGLAKQMIGKGTDGQTLGVVATALRKLAPFEYLNRPAQDREKEEGEISPFSVSEWVRDNDDKRWVFLVSTDSALAQTEVFFRVWISILTRSLMSRSESEANERIYFICDELATVGKIPRLSDFLTAVRRKRGRAILGFQTMSQIDAIYGREDFKTILQGLQNLIVFRCADPDMANLMAERFGKFEALGHSYSESYDKDARKYVPQVTEKIDEKWVFSPNMIMNLSIGEAVLGIAQFSPCRVKFPEMNFPQVQPTAQAYTRRKDPVPRAGAVASTEAKPIVAIAIDAHVEAKEAAISLGNPGYDL